VAERNIPPVAPIFEIESKRSVRISGTGRYAAKENLSARSAMDVNVPSVISAPASGCLLARSIATAPPSECP
jgi:hypothetical protein